MKIAFVIDHYRPGKGGLEVWLAGLTDYLRAAGDEVTFITFETLSPKGRGRATRDRSFAERAREFTGAGEFDAVVGLRHCLSCDLYAPHGGAVAAALAAHRRSKRLPSLPSPRIRNFLALESELLTGESPPRSILAVSGMVERDLAERYPNVADRIVVVPNGVDLLRFTPAGREEARKTLGVERNRVLLFMAANPKLKGVSEVKEAFSQLHREDDRTVLLLAGGSPGRLPSGASYLGALAEPEIALRAADVLLHPTHYDPFPLVTLEALASGTPVVTTDQNGAVEHLGRTGPVCAVKRPEDVVGLVAATRELLAGDFREDARAVAERFPIEACHESVRALL
jgi:UDP-glucose:(heptosyl)LPS alpha-1,3-glucosyltransferase